MRRLPVKLAMAVLAVGGGYWGAMTLAPPASELRPTSTPIVVPSGEAGAADAVGSSASGASFSGNDDQLILDVLDTLERRANIVAKIRQSVRLGDDRLTGEGQFWQQGIGNVRKTRWDLKTLVAGETAFVTQIYDGEEVWTDRKLPAKRTVTRVDMATLQVELAALPRDERQSRGPLGESMLELLARGGLSQLVAGLYRSFTFGPRQTLRQGDRTVLAVIGQWRPEQLQRVWPGASPANLGDWPTQLPHHVLLYIDANDRFPYLVEYRGAGQAGMTTSSDAHYPARDPLATFEFIDVQFAVVNVPADTFEFTKPDNNFTDITARVIEELRPPAAPVDDASTARREGTWR